MDEVKRVTENQRISAGRILIRSGVYLASAFIAEFTLGSLQKVAGYHFSALTLAKAVIFLLAQTLGEEAIFRLPFVLVVRHIENVKQKQDKSNVITLVILQVLLLWGSVGFGLMHSAGTRLEATVIGLAFTLVAVQDKSIASTWVLHFVNNIFAFSISSNASFVGANLPGFNPAFISSASTTLTTAKALILALPQLWLWWRWGKSLFLKH